MNKDRQKYAKEELKKKINYELKLSPKIKKIFLKISKDAQKLYKISGHSLDSEYYETEIEAQLIGQYRNVSTDFALSTIERIKAEIEGKFNTQEIEKKAIKEKQLRDKLALFSRDQSKISAKKITETTNKEIDKFITHGIAIHLLEDYKFPSKNSLEHAALQIKQILENTVLSESSKNYSIDAVLRNANAERKDGVVTDIDAATIRSNASKFLGEKLKETSDYRSNMIALTETQNAAEGAKQAVLEDFKNIFETSLTATQYLLKKQWIAVLDERTREWHAEADTQIQGIFQPYIVNGEKLMHPRDTSLGASLNNVINCRCSSMPVIYTNYNTFDQD